jgi:hypothetical protein
LVRDALFLSLQSLERLALAEGEKFVLVGVSSAAEQGVFSLVANLGILVLFRWFVRVV